MKNWIVTACLIMASTLVLAQPIYKVVDEDGNVTYTDQRPSDDAEPMELPELNVLDSRAPPPTVGGSDEEVSVEPLRLTISSPQNEENIFGTGNTLDVSLESSIDLPPTALIVIYLNGEAQDPIQSLDYSFDFIPRGTHTLRAELRTAAGRVLAETDTITFFMRQASRLNPPGP
jgi:hypothetical protein